MAPDPILAPRSWTMDPSPGTNNDPGAEERFYIAKAQFTRAFCAALHTASPSARARRLRCSSSAGASSVMPGLFLGSSEDESDLAVLEACGITHVLQVGAELRPSHSERCCYLTLPAFDLEEQDLLGLLPACLSFIQDAHASGGVVLVHCVAGVSRSAAVVIAHVMWTQSLPFAEARSLVKAARPRINLNLGFVLQLQLFEQLGLAGLVPWGPTETAGLGACLARVWQPWDLARFLQAKRDAEASGFGSADDRTLRSGGGDDAAAAPLLLPDGGGDEASGHEGEEPGQAEELVPCCRFPEVGVHEHGHDVPPQQQPSTGSIGPVMAAAAPPRRATDGDGVSLGRAPERALRCGGLGEVEHLGRAASAVGGPAGAFPTAGRRQSHGAAVTGPPTAGAAWFWSQRGGLTTAAALGSDAPVYRHQLGKPRSPTCRNGGEPEDGGSGLTSCSGSSSASDGTADAWPDSQSGASALRSLSCSLDGVGGRVEEQSGCAALRQAPEQWWQGGAAAWPPLLSSVPPDPANAHHCDTVVGSPSPRAAHLLAAGSPAQPATATTRPFAAGGSGAVVAAAASSPRLVLLGRSPAALPSSQPPTPPSHSPAWTARGTAVFGAAQAGPGASPLCNHRVTHARADALQQLAAPGTRASTQQAPVQQAVQQQYGGDGGSTLDINTPPPVLPDLASSPRRMCYHPSLDGSQCPCPGTGHGVLSNSCLSLSSSGAPSSWSSSLQGGHAGDAAGPSPGRSLNGDWSLSAPRSDGVASSMASCAPALPWGSHCGAAGSGSVASSSVGAGGVQGKGSMLWRQGSVPAVPPSAPFTHAAQCGKRVSEGAGTGSGSVQGWGQGQGSMLWQQGWQPARQPAAMQCGGAGSMGLQGSGEEGASLGQVQAPAQGQGSVPVVPASWAAMHATQRGKRASESTCVGAAGGGMQLQG